MPKKEETMTDKPKLKSNRPVEIKESIHPDVYARFEAYSEDKSMEKGYALETIMREYLDEFYSKKPGRKRLTADPEIETAVTPVKPNGLHQEER